MYVNVAGVISIPAHLCGSFKLFPLQSHALLFLSLCFLFRMNFFKATVLNLIGIYLLDLTAASSTGRFAL